MNIIIENFNRIINGGRKNKKSVKAKEKRPRKEERVIHQHGKNSTYIKEFNGTINIK